MGGTEVRFFQWVSNQGREKTVSTEFYPESSTTPFLVDRNETLLPSETLCAASSIAIAKLHEICTQRESDLLLTLNVDLEVQRSFLQSLSHTLVQAGLRFDRSFHRPAVGLAAAAAAEGYLNPWGPPHRDAIAAR